MAAELVSHSSGSNRSSSASPEATLSSSSQSSPQPFSNSTSISPQDSIDFILYPAEVAKGRRAAENYLSTFKSEENRRNAEEALETLATVISGGKCDSVDFPWQQVRPYHGAAALTILKEKGAPGRIEALRCRRDATRSYRVVPDSYPPRQVQKIRSTLTKVIQECCELGFLEEEEAATPTAPTGKATAKTNGKKARARKTTATTAKTPVKGRLLGDGELRALVAASIAEEAAEGSRDAVLFSLVYRGLKIAEITSLTIENVRFSNKTAQCHIVTRPNGSGARGRRVALTNDEMICLEDWIDYRGNAKGPLLCTVGRGGKIEGKRLTTAILKATCEKRAEQAEVQPFSPNDLSRSAQALTDHRKAARKRSARHAQETPSEAEQLLFEGEIDASASATAGEAIRFPFLGLGI